MSVSEVNDAVVSLKAAMMEGSADRNQVIDMLSTLLRGGPSASEVEFHAPLRCTLGGSKAQSSLCWHVIGQSPFG